MLTAELNQRDLASLRATREFPTVSLIMPTHRTYPDNKQDPVLLRNLLEEASTRLHNANLPHGIAAEVTSSLEAAATSVDRSHAAEALVLFAAPGGEHHSFVVPYVHPQPRVAIGQSFATRDLVAAQGHVWNYWVLVLSEQPTRLWSGVGEQLTQSNAVGFPMMYADSLPDASVSSHRGPVPRARHAEQIRNDRREQSRGVPGGRPPGLAEFRHIFGEMVTVLADDGRPLVVTGAPRYLSYFEQLAPAAVKGQFIGSAEGSFGDTSAPELAAIIAPVLIEERETPAARGDQPARDREVRAAVRQRAHPGMGPRGGRADPRADRRGGVPGAGSRVRWPPAAAG